MECLFERRNVVPAILKSKQQLHKCSLCGKPIEPKDEWLGSAMTGSHTNYYHEYCFMTLKKDKEDR
jgi:hypothetical protein